MNQLLVRSPWKGSGTAPDAFRPAVADDHPALLWVFADSLDGGKGEGALRMACSDATLAALLADPKYRHRVTVLS
jgi:hypothetical protein